MTQGAGLFIGAWISGRVVETYATTLQSGVVAHDWRSIWVVPAVMAAVVLLVFAVLFRPGKEARAAGESTAPGRETASGR